MSSKSSGHATRAVCPSDLRDRRKIAVIDRGVAYTGSMLPIRASSSRTPASVNGRRYGPHRGPAAWALEAVSLSLTACKPAATFLPEPLISLDRQQPRPDLPLPAH
jgi:hypothetical protein